MNKGTLSITSPEYTKLVCASSHIRHALSQLKKKYVIGLHLNWHLDSYVHDPIIDFIFSTPKDLGSGSQKHSHLCIGLDACDFPPPFFTPSCPLNERAWDILWFGRPVEFKQPRLFIEIVKNLIAIKDDLRILMVAPIPSNDQHSSSDCYHTIYEDYINNFSESQRQNFLLMAPKGYELPYSIHTVSWFFNNSKIFIHTSPSERRCRTMSYAVKSGCSCIGTFNTLSIIPEDYRVFPFVNSYDSPDELVTRTYEHLEYIKNSRSALLAKSSEYLSKSIDTSRNLSLLNQRIISVVGHPINPIVNTINLDMRLGRHIKISHEKNNINCDPLQFFGALMQERLWEQVHIDSSSDPELKLAALLQ